MTRNKKKPKEKRKCRHCGQSFVANRAWAEFCSPKCRVDHWRENNPRIPIEELNRLRARQ